MKTRRFVELIHKYMFEMRTWDDPDPRNSLSYGDKIFVCVFFKLWDIYL